MLNHTNWEECGREGLFLISCYPGEQLRTMRDMIILVQDLNGHIENIAMARRKVVLAVIWQQKDWSKRILEFEHVTGIVLCKTVCNYTGDALLLIS